MRWGRLTALANLHGEVRITSYECLGPSCLVINNLIPVGVNELAKCAIVGGNNACYQHSFNTLERQRLVLEKCRHCEDIKGVSRVFTSKLVGVRDEKQLEDLHSFLTENLIGEFGKGEVVRLNGGRRVAVPVVAADICHFTVNYTAAGWTREDLKVVGLGCIIVLNPVLCFGEIST